MEPQESSSAVSPDAQAAFQLWQANNTDGDYVNLKAAARGMLHRVGCPHVGGPEDWEPRFENLVKRAKVCYRDRPTLLSWSNTHGIDLEMCGDCKP